MNKMILTKYVSAFVLGDGSLRRRKPTWNAIYKFSQIALHKDYVDWQANILENISPVNIMYRPEFIQTTGAIGKESYTIETRALPFYTTLYERIYVGENNIKSLSPHDLKLFDWESAAIWYMDDGYYHNTHKTSYLCTDNYTYGDCLLLQKLLHEKLGIYTYLSRRKLKYTIGYRVTISRKSLNMFIDGIKPYILPSFDYKLCARTIDPSLEGDDTVRPSLENEELGRNDLALEIE